MTEAELAKLNEELAAYQARTEVEHEAQMKAMKEQQEKMMAINANLQDTLNNYYASRITEYQQTEEP